MSILLIGKNGQLGSELHRQLSPQCRVIALGRDEIDLNRPESVSKTLKIVPTISLLLNAAAYTDVDRTETDKKTAANVNTFSPEMMAVEAKRRGIPIIHFSTDYVFDGIARSIPYTEEDKPNPLSAYGRTKLGGEITVREIHEKHLIFRTSGIYGGRRNFVRTMLALSAEGKVPRVVCDQTVSPNWSRELAKSIVGVVERVLSGAPIPWGTYHLSGGGETTWFDFATYLCSRVRKRDHSSPPYPQPTTSAEFGAVARRPAYSVLNSEKIRQAFGTTLPGWKEQFDMFVQEERHVS